MCLWLCHGNTCMFMGKKYTVNIQYIWCFIPLVFSNPCFMLSPAVPKWMLVQTHAHTHTSISVFVEKISNLELWEEILWWKELCSYTHENCLATLLNKQQKRMLINFIFKILCYFPKAVPVTHSIVIMQLGQHSHWHMNRYKHVSISIKTWQQEQILTNVSQNVHLPQMNVMENLTLLNKLQQITWTFSSGK